MGRLSVLISIGMLSGCLAVSSTGVTVQVGAGHGAAKPVHGSKKPYTDPEGGVSLQYPANWTFSRNASSYLSHVIASDGETLQADLSFNPKGNYYEHTTLTALEFVYRRKSTPTRQACVVLLVDSSGNGEAPAPLTTRGVTYAHLSTGDAGMMKSVKQDGYATWRRGICYLFESDFSQISLGVDAEKNRALTKSEYQALERHLTDIMQSVEFTLPASRDSLRRAPVHTGFIRVQ